MKRTLVRNALCGVIFLLLAGASGVLPVLPAGTDDAGEAFAAKKRRTAAAVTPVPTPVPTPAATVWSAAEEVWLKKMNSIELGAKKVFSFRKWIGQQEDMPALKVAEKERLASLLYESAVLYNLTIGDRTPHAKINDAYSIGFDVSLQSEKQDLTFMNDYSNLMKLKVEFVAGQEPLFSWTAPSDKNWKMLNLEVTQRIIPPPVQLIADVTLGPSAKVQRSVGTSGLLVKLYSVEEGNKKRLISRDFYAPRPNVVAVGIERSNQ